MTTLEASIFTRFFVLAFLVLASSGFPATTFAAGDAAPKTADSAASTESGQIPPPYEEGVLAATWNGFVNWINNSVWPLVIVGVAVWIGVPMLLKSRFNSDDIG